MHLDGGGGRRVGVGGALVYQRVELRGHQLEHVQRPRVREQGGEGVGQAASGLRDTRAEHAVSELHPPVHGDAVA